MTTPTLGEAISLMIENRLLDLHTAIPGKVKKYDASSQTAEVELVVRRVQLTDDGEKFVEPYPIIPNVPVQWPRGGGCYLHFPLTAGDHVLLVFSESAIGNWRESGTTSEPGDLARHDLSYPVAIPGIAPNAGKLTDTTGPMLAVSAPLAVASEGGSAAAQFVALANLVAAELSALKSAIVSAAAAEASGSGLNGMTALNTALSAWPSPAGVAATKLKAE